MISVLVADDHGIVRQGIRRIVEDEPDIAVCAEAADGREVLEEIRRHMPDVVLLDVQMPRLGGLEALKRIRSEFAGVRVILLSVRSDAPLVQAALSLGADGYLEKNVQPQEIVRAVRDVVRGGSSFSPAVQREIVEQLRHPNADRHPFAALTTRELEVMRLTSEGLSSKEAASALGISVKTCEAHRTSAMRKLNVKKATELVRIALRYGLIHP